METLIKPREKLTSKLRKKCLDDYISEKDKQEIDLLKQKMRTVGTEICEYLKRDGEYLFFCARNLKEEDLKNSKISQSNKKYVNRVSIAEIQILCLDPIKCCSYQRKLKFG